MKIHWILYTVKRVSARRRGWRFRFANGNQAVDSKSFAISAWAVHPGNAAAIPEPDTYAMMLAGLGLLGLIAWRRKQKQAP